MAGAAEGIALAVGAAGAALALAGLAWFAWAAWCLARAPVALSSAGALRVLEGSSSTAGLVLAADLHAASGQLARAVGTIERVLARDLGAPGARERHQRWSQSLGYTRREVRRLDEATVVTARAPKGPFRLLREVARGGAGAVYEAEDELLGRRVAFKVYHGRGADRAQLEREARLTAQLGGPGVLRVFDADPEEGWLSLEWVPRGSLRDILRTGSTELLAPVGRWARPLARAVARVHAAGLVHADVKPANVLLRQPHDPVLGDFGSARRAGAPGDGGSPGYVSPERLAGRGSHPRDDVYGYGRVLEDVLHRLDDAPGVADDPDRARADLAAAPPPLAPEAAEALTEARAAFRRGDYAAARGTARKLLAIVPDNDAARRLAVSSSCRLRDAAGARADVAAIAADQRAAVVRYCATAGVALDAAP